jgi:septal ring factor EnvC (AmiA/AmiB activator)
MRKRRGGRGLAIRERLAAADRSNTEWQSDLAGSYARLASVYRRQGNAADALAALRKGRDIMAALVAIAPSNAQWKKDLAWFDDQIARLEVQKQEAGRK